MIYPKISLQNLIRHYILLVHSIRKSFRFKTIDETFIVLISLWNFDQQNEFLKWIIFFSKNNFFVSPFICKKRSHFVLWSIAIASSYFNQKPFDTEFVLVWLVQIQRVYVCDSFGGHFIVLHISFDLVLTIIVIYSLSPCAFVCYDTTKSST